MCVEYDENESWSGKERSLARALQRNFHEEVVHNVLVPMITNRAPVSLRTIDWAVVNWSKKHNTVCPSPSGGMTNVYDSYKMMLQKWRRRLFDPFRRRARMQIRFQSELFETTLGQMNFALWLYKSGTYAYILSHVDDIERDMNTVLRKSRTLATRKKRTELTKMPASGCVAFTSPCNLTFR